MKFYLIIILLFIAGSTYAQVNTPTGNAQNDFSRFNGGIGIAKQLVIPSDTTILYQVSKANSIALKNGVLYYNNGTRFIAFSSGGGGGTDTTGFNLATKPYVNAQIAAIPAPTWTSVTGKPSSFPPSAHTHVVGDILPAGATSGQVIGYNGSAVTWVTPSGGGTSYTASNGITLTGTNFALTDQTYTSVEKTKLASVATGATANSTDAQLRDRATHTGVQAESTITGLVSDLAAKQSTLVSGSNIKTINGNSLLGSGDLTISGGGSGISGLTTNYLSKATSSTTIGNSQIIDNGTNVGIDMPSPSYKLDVMGRTRIQNDLVIGSSTPTSWTSYNGSFDGGSSAVVFGSAGDFHLVSNGKGLGSWTYYNNGPAANMYIYQGSLHFRNAPSGTAGNSINWTDVFSIDNTGKIGLMVLPEYADDITAAAGGIAVGQLYRTGSFVKQRVN